MVYVVGFGIGGGFCCRFDDGWIVFWFVYCCGIFLGVGGLGVLVIVWLFFGVCEEFGSVGVGVVFVCVYGGGCFIYFWFGVCCVC